MRNQVDRKKNKRIQYTSVILLFISISLFISSTYAWFTDTAVVKGNKVFAGNLYVDVIATVDDLIEAGFVNDQTTDIVDNGDGTVTINGIAEPAKVYEKNFNDGTSKTYYVLTDIEAPMINLYNVEPGQAFDVNFGVLNSGDLAIKYSGGFQISLDEDGHKRSYTGLETLEKQHDPNDDIFGVYHNNYHVSSGTIDVKSYEESIGNYDGSLTLDDDQYEIRKHKLELMQYDFFNSRDIGGHLEDVLEVYAIDKDSRDANGNATRSAIKESNYIGTVKQIMDVFDPNVENTSELLQVEERLGLASTGYCLPIETIKNPVNNTFLKTGVTVKIYGSQDNVTSDELVETKTNVSELSEVEYIIYMPEDVDNKYQNASLFLDMGVTATQVEFEYDGLNYMVYDKDLSIGTLNPLNPSSNPGHDPEPTPGPITPGGGGDNPQPEPQPINPDDFPGANIFKITKDNDAITEIDLQSPGDYRFNISYESVAVYDNNVDDYIYGSLKSTIIQEYNYLYPPVLDFMYFNYNDHLYYLLKTGEGYTNSSITFDPDMISGLKDYTEFYSSFIAALNNVYGTHHSGQTIVTTESSIDDVGNALIKMFYTILYHNEIDTNDGKLILAFAISCTSVGGDSIYPGTTVNRENLIIQIVEPPADCK